MRRLITEEEDFDGILSLENKHTNNYHIAIDKNQLNSRSVVQAPCQLWRNSDNLLLSEVLIHNVNEKDNESFTTKIFNSERHDSHKIANIWLLVVKFNFAVISTLIFLWNILLNIIVFK